MKRVPMPEDGDRVWMKHKSGKIVITPQSDMIPEISNFIRSYWTAWVNVQDEGLIRVIDLKWDTPSESWIEQQ